MVVVVPARGADCILGIIGLVKGVKKVAVPARGADCIVNEE